MIPTKTPELMPHVNLCRANSVKVAMWTQSSPMSAKQKPKHNV